jgi:Sec-independent protein translocase protein TatA
MLTLDPLKLLLIGVVALVVLGPEQVPKVAGRAGSLLSDLRRLRTSLHDQATQTFGDHPLVTELTHARRTIAETLEGADPRGAAPRLGGGAGPVSPSTGEVPSPVEQSDASPRFWPESGPHDRPGRGSIGPSPAAADRSAD